MRPTVGAFRWIERNANHILLVILLSLFVLDPLTGPQVQLNRFVYSAIPIAASLSMLRDRRVFVGGIGLAILALASRVFEVGQPETFSLAVGALAFVYSIAVILYRVFSHPVVTGSTLSGALSVYLLIGVLWAILYLLAYELDPAAFSGAMGESVDSDLVYLSFVTLTTLGYGDIAPATEATKHLATLEAIVGQLYLVTMIARLVSVMTVARHARGE